MTALIRHYLSWTVLWCAIRGRHKGHVHYMHGLLGAYWMCDNCGAVLR
jgi:hypothetical protein